MPFVILIGGSSSRFGTDKGIFEYRGKPLIEYQLETLLSFNREIYLVARSSAQVRAYKEKTPSTSEVDFIIDEREMTSKVNVRTPLLGMFSAFKKLDELGGCHAFTLSCDMPFIKVDVIKHLINELMGHDCVIPRWENGYMEPLFAIYPIKKALPLIKKNLLQENFRLINVLSEDWDINYVPIENEIQPLDEDLISFMNINSKQALEELK